MLWLTLVIALTTGWFSSNRRLIEVESEYQPLQDAFDAMKERAAEAKMDEQFAKRLRRPQPPRPTGPLTVLL